MYHSHPEIRRARRWAEPAGRCVDAGSGRVGKPGNQLRPWDLVQPRGSRVSPANHRGGGWDFEPVTASSSVGRIALEPCGSDCGWRRVTRVAGSRLQPYRMETCDTEEPDEGKLHVRIRGEAGGASPRLYPDTRAGVGPVASGYVFPSPPPDPWSGTGSLPDT